MTQALGRPRGIGMTKGRWAYQWLVVPCRCRMCNRLCLSDWSRATAAPALDAADREPERGNGDYPATGALRTKLRPAKLSGPAGQPAGGTNYFRNLRRLRACFAERITGPHGARHAGTAGRAPGATLLISRRAFLRALKPR